MSAARLAVIGAGTMGRGIAETAATHGLEVIVVEVSDKQRDVARELIGRSIEKGIQRRKIAETRPETILNRISWQGSLEAARDAGIVIEAVPEDEAVKLDIFKSLDALTGPQCVLASNTSSISITRLAAATSRADRIVGMHFFNPVPVMVPVEIVCSSETSRETITRIRDLACQMGKQAFEVRDVPGFVVNRVLMPLINEAAHALHTKVADAATIDSLMKLGCNHPMGPLELADFVGLDVCLSILQVLHRDLADDKFRPCPLLVEMVRAGHLGRKSGQGFYEYQR